MYTAAHRRIYRFFLTSRIFLSAASNPCEALKNFPAVSSPHRQLALRFVTKIPRGSAQITKKSKSLWYCKHCGEKYDAWGTICEACKESGSMEKVIEEEHARGGARNRVGEANDKDEDRGWLSFSSSADIKPVPLSVRDGGTDTQIYRLPLPGDFGIEVARVLGGGLVVGSLVLVGGDPGVGKSTLLLQVGALLAEGCEIYGPAPVLYVSGEESVEQIRDRGARMNIKSNELHLYPCTDLEDIFDKVRKLNPRAVIVDSIQTIYLRRITGSAGSISQVKECAAHLLRFAKKTRIPFFLVGHVTKAGDIAGPRMLEHIVDVVLYIEGERILSHHLLRVVKNRFGSINEIGVLEMVHTGLQAVSNPSELYLGERNTDQEVLVGSAISAIIDGSRPFLIETQALCCTKMPTTKRYNGIQERRADNIIAVLIKQAGLKLQNQVVILNVVGGEQLYEPAGDLAIAASICSSFLEIPLPSGIAFIGEIGLGGELRTVARMNMRINELDKLGFKKCVIPNSSMKSIGGYEWENISIIGCDSVKEMIEAVFTSTFQNPDTPEFPNLDVPEPQ